MTGVGASAGDRVRRPPVTVLAKHVVDRFAAVLLLIGLSPLLALIALVVLAKDGRPVLFVPMRLGQRGRPFPCYKFRTMVRDADARLDSKGRPTGERVTALGRWLRRFSLDELPQLANIARGEMSFVGPRPPLPSHLPRYSPEQLRRFDVRPGLTGLAQINGRNRLLWSHRIAYDLEYVRMHSLGLDLRIVLRTFGVVLSGRGLALDRNPDEVDDLPRDAVSPPGPHQCEVLPPGPPRSAVP